MEENKQVVDFDYLNQIKYHKLEDKLKELGVSEAWVGGKSKKDIINDALKRLANIKVLKEKGTPEEDIQKELDLIKAEEQEQAQEALLEAEIAEAEKREEKIEEIKSYEYTPAQIKRSLEVVEMNLKNGVPAQRNKLLEKKVLLKQMLEEQE